MEDRRGGTRHEVWFPVRLQSSELKDRIAVSRDVSSGGLLLSAKTNLEPGAVVSVSFRVLPEDAEERTVSGRIVRVETNTDDPDGLWPLRIAIAFDEPVPALEEQLAAAVEDRKHGRS